MYIKSRKEEVTSSLHFTVFIASTNPKMIMFEAAEKLKQNKLTEKLCLISHGPISDASYLFSSFYNLFKNKQPLILCFH